VNRFLPRGGLQLKQRLPIVHYQDRIGMRAARVALDRGKGFGTRRRLGGPGDAEHQGQGAGQPAGSWHRNLVQ